VADPDELVAAAVAYEPDVVLCALQLDGVSALELCDELRSTDVGSRTPFVVVTPHLLGDEEVAAVLLAGADDVVQNARSRSAELRARVRNQLRHKRGLDAVRRLRDEREVLRRDAHVDPLTGVWNRRAFEGMLDAHVARRQRFALLFVDVDHFKRVNDLCGHDAGDAVLAHLAGVLAADVRPGDAAARLGGEEFVVLLLAANAEGACAAAERLRMAAACAAPGGPPAITVSIGVAVAELGDESSADDLLRRADAALYAAKRAGRDRVVAWTPHLPMAKGPTRRQSGAIRRASISGEMPWVAPLAREGGSS
jgi:diguanylate cyclase (GGDEF)-like protein